MHQGPVKCGHSRAVQDERARLELVFFCDFRAGHPQAELRERPSRPAGEHAAGCSPEAGILAAIKPLLVVIASQLLFTTGDLLARLKMRQLGFDSEAFVSWWFAGYMLIRTTATFGQLWVLAKLVLGQALPMFAASSVVLSMLLSVTVLNEGLTTRTVVGGLLAVAALVTLTLPS